MSVGAAVRSRFPIFEHTTYANSCSQGALAVEVREAYEDYLAGWDERGSEWEHWVERAETARVERGRQVKIRVGHRIAANSLYRSTGCMPAQPTTAQRRRRRPAQPAVGREP